MEHISDTMLRRHFAEQLVPAETRAVDDHLDECPLCQDRANHLLNELWTVPPPNFVNEPSAAVGNGSPLAVPGYEMLGVLGSGGMGVVYKARHLRLDRVVALKMILNGRHTAPESRLRFEIEAKAVARLFHPNVVQLYELGEHDGLPFFSLEFCPGGSLKQKLAGRPLPPREAALLLEKLAQAVAAAHARGLVHRDIKPANVLLMEDGTPKITDFGLARNLNHDTSPTICGAIMGTPSYMAPEQAEGKEAGPAADVYALGAVLYEVLTGQPPFQGSSALEILDQKRNGPPVSLRTLTPQLPRDLETVCLMCLEQRPEKRYLSAAALADDLARWLRGEPVRARRIGPLGRIWRWCHRNPGLAALTTALTLVLLAGITGILIQWREANVARREAEASDTQTQELLNELLPTSPGAPHQMRYSQRLPSIDALRKAEVHFESLLRKRPGDTRVRIALTHVRGTLGTLYDLRWQLAEMDGCYQNARELWRALVLQNPRNPEYRDWLAITCHWEATGASKQLHHTRRVRLSLQAAALWQELAQEQPDNVALLQKVEESRWFLLALRKPGLGGKELLSTLEQERTLLDRRVYEEPNAPALRKCLALTCLVLGEFHLGRGSTRQALPCWRQAHEHYRKLAREQPDDPLVKLNLALCCIRLMRGQAADPCYIEAVSVLRQADKRLAALARQHPDGDWLRYARLEAYCSLAVCHWKAGRTDQADRTFRDQVRPHVALLSRHLADPKQVFNMLDCLSHAANSLREGKHPGVLTVAREAAVLAEQCADSPSRDMEFCGRLARRSMGVVVLLNHLGQPKESLRLAEQIRRLYTGLHRAAPDVPEYVHGLSDVWQRIGKAFEQAPLVRESRMRLSRCYDRLVHWGGLCGDRATVFAALLEREKLCPDNEEELLEVSVDFQKLAEAVGKGRTQLSPQEQAERKRYLAESRRARRAAKAVRPAAQGGTQR